jgi:hypothetical protein
MKSRGSALLSQPVLTALGQKATSQVRYNPPLLAAAHAPLHPPQQLHTVRLLNYSNTSSTPQPTSTNTRSACGSTCWSKQALTYSDRARGSAPFLTMTCAAGNAPCSQLLKSVIQPEAPRSIPLPYVIELPSALTWTVSPCTSLLVTLRRRALEPLYTRPAAAAAVADFDVRAVELQLL